MHVRIPGATVGGLVVLLSAILTAAPDLCLINGVREQNVAAVRKLLQEHVDVNVRQPDGPTALHWAVHRDDVDTIRLLVRAGPRADAANDYGMTPLVLACTNGSAAAVATLLEAGADPDMALPSRQTPLITAPQTRNVDA